MLSTNYKETPISHAFKPRTVRPFMSFSLDSKTERAVMDDVRSLSKLGIHVSPNAIRRMMDAREQLMQQYTAYGMDTNNYGSLQPTVTTPSLVTPVQFLQTWLPGAVQTLTAVRMIDEAVGLSVMGSWEDEQVVQAYIERLGKAVPYTDQGNMPLADFNMNFSVNNVVRFELGIQVTMLEQAQTARVRADAASEKRGGVMNELEIARNETGWYGFNGGANNTYGMLNAPNLPAYVPVPAGASLSTEWANKTFLEITQDIRTFMSGLRTSSQNRVDPKKFPTTMLIPVSVEEQLTKLNDLGTKDVEEWVKETYPKLRIIGVPELENAVSGSNACYVYADEVMDGISTDGGATFVQPVPTKFMVLGVRTDVKGFQEGFTNATAGIICKRPFAVYRASEI